MENLIHAQILAAQQAIPNKGGVIQGLRKIKLGKHGSRSALFCSVKNNAYIPIESNLEFSFCHWLEADESVSKYRTQALKIPYRQRSHLYPDFLIFRHDNTSPICEVKGDAFRASASTQAKLTYLSRIFADAGCDFSVVGDKDVWSAIELNNRSMFYNRGAFSVLPEQTIQMVVDIVSALSTHQRSIGFVRKEIASHGLASSSLERSLFLGRIKCSMCRRVDENTVVEVAK